MTQNPFISSGLDNRLSDIFSRDVSWTQQRRLQAYRKYWLYYLGQHWSYNRDEGEAQLTLNYSRRLVDLHNNFTFKKGFKTVIPDDPTTEQDEAGEREFVRHMLEEAWRLNKQQLWCITAGQMGGVTGDVFVRVSWDDTKPLEPAYAKADIIPSHFVFPDPGGNSGWGTDSVGRVLIMVPTFKDARDSELSNRGFRQVNKTSGTQRLTFLMEEWTDPEYHPINKKQIQPAMFRLWDGDTVIEEKENPIGMIPIVHISNYPLAGEYFGLSDLTDITELNREYNEKNTDISDIINYHGSPITIIEGAKLKDLEKGVNRVWGIPEGGKVTNLSLDGDLGAANAHTETLKKTMLELTNTPPQALGMIQAISNTSGVTMQLQYLPMIEKRDIKVQTYGQGIESINRLMIRVTEIADPEFGNKFAKLTGDKYRNSVVFPDPLPQDERRELELAKERIDMGVSNRKRELERSGISQKEVEAIFEQARKERMEDATMEYSYGPGMFDTSPGSGNFQAIRGGSNETRGEKIDDNIQKKTEEDTSETEKDSKVD